MRVLLLKQQDKAALRIWGGYLKVDVHGMQENLLMLQIMNAFNSY
jgi:hypothetical protein